MPDELKYDLDFCPKSYWISDATKATLMRIKGQARRQLVMNLLKRGFTQFDGDPFFAESLSERERQSIGRGHPGMMGGEYLPNELPGEVEIARLVLASTTQDVISLRARPMKSEIRYRM